MANRKPLVLVDGAPGQLSDADKLPLSAVDGAVSTSDARLSDAREWTAETVSQAEAEAGTATTRRAWTAQRVWQAVSAWFATVLGHSTGNAVPAGGANGALTIGTNDATALTLKTGGTPRVTVDSAGNVLVTGSGGLGYGVGSGGTVIQSTSKSTAVTLNKPCGQITMHNAELAIDESIFFILNNTFIRASDIVVVCPNYGFNAGGYRTEAAHVGNGEVVFRVTNVSGVSKSEPVTLIFAVIKGATS